MQVFEENDFHDCIDSVSDVLYNMPSPFVSSTQLLLADVVGVVIEKFCNSRIATASERDAATVGLKVSLGSSARGFYYKTLFKLETRNELCPKWFSHRASIFSFCTQILVSMTFQEGP